MKRKYADRNGWSRIMEQRYEQERVDGKSFKGYVCLLYLDKVRHPLWVRYDRSSLCIVNNGYVWMQHFPDHGGYVLTTVLDAGLHVVQWYFDVTRSTGLTPDHIPYLEDLYLDVVALPGGQLHLLDEDELQDACRAGLITEEEVNRAYETARDIMEGVKQGRNEMVLDSMRRIEALRRSATNPSAESGRAE